MNAVLAMLFDDLLRAVVIWISLLIIAFAMLTGLVGRRRQPKSANVNGPRLKRVRLEARAQELARYSREIDIAAKRAVTMAERRRTEWLSTLSAVDSTWQAFLAADEEARRVIMAAGMPLPPTPRTPSEYAYRERYLHHAAMSACSRRELSALDLSDALAHRRGWDPTLHPFEQQVVLRKFARENQLASLRTARGLEQAAWKAADVAAVAARSLRAEAFAAKEQARQARQMAGPVAPVRVRPTWDGRTQTIAVAR